MKHTGILIDDYIKTSKERKPYLDIGILTEFCKFHSLSILQTHITFAKLTIQMVVR